MKTKRGVGLGILVILVIFSIELVYAADFTYVISNSEDWKDVYSVMLYANLQKIGSDFLVSTRHGPILLNGIEKSNKIRVISSRTRPFVFNYADEIKARGYASAEETMVNSANLELIPELTDVNSFIIVGSSYGYDAIAVAPYAVLTRSWVFFADRTNTAEIDSILTNRNVKSVIVYGYLEKPIRDVFAKYNPEFIDNGDRFKNNIAIVEKYQKINPVKQVVLTNGEFIEKEVVGGATPVLFTGRDNVPAQIAEYIKKSQLEVGVLIGNELVMSATNIRRTTGLNVMVKFARGARAPTGSVSAVEGLDLYYLPAPSMKLLIYSANYNRVNSNLEITYKSESNLPIFFKGTISFPNIVSETGVKRVGDMEPIFIAPNDYRTVSYSGLNLEGSNITAQISTLYGESPSSLDRILEATLTLNIVNVIDNCNIDLKKLKYNKQKKVLLVRVKNIGDVNCWVDVELSNLVIDGVKKIVGTEGSTSILKGKTKDIQINTELSDADIEANKIVDVTAYYGERQDSLVKVIKAKLTLEIERLTLLTYIIIILAVLIVLLLILLFIIRRRKEDDE